MQKIMLPWLAVQFVLGGATALVLALFISLLPDQSAFALALWAWLGFFVPTQASAVIFGGTDPKWMGVKIAVMAGGSLACLMVTTLVLSLF